MHPADRRHTRRKLRLLACASALAVPLVGWTARTIALSSVTIAPAEVISGDRAVGTVTLDAFTKSATVTLTSSNTSVATVTSPITISGTSGTFTARGVSGAAGCVTVTARMGLTSQRTARFAVLPIPSPSGSAVRLRLADSSIVSGQTGEGRIFLPTATTTTTVQLSSSDPAAATVPASIQVPVQTTEMGIFGSASFPITTTTSGVLRCPVITATSNGVSSRVLLKIFPIGG